LWHNNGMGKKERLYARIINSQKNVRFQDFCTLLEYFGFVRVRVRGSHHLYQHPDIDELMNVQPKKDGLAKAYQVRQFLKLLASHDLQLEDEPDEQ
jgi:predicted RNA binding protein YcfA (HicA-like mRNA interferase family)